MRRNAAFIITLGLLGVLIVLLGLGEVVGWNATWRAFGVTPLQPHFADTRVVIDYAECALRGTDPYVPHACNSANLNIPPIWLWIGRAAVGRNVVWFSCGMIAAAAVTLISLFRGRPATDGAIALLGVVSPSVLMGVERGQPDLLIFAITGAALLGYDAKSLARHFCAPALIALALILKLFPVFSVAIVLRRSRRDWFYAALISAIGFVYLIAIFRYILLIRSNVPTTFILSYGYKALFLGIDQLRTEAALPPFGLGGTWIPFFVTVFMQSMAAALSIFYFGRIRCEVSPNLPGTAFIFGSAIYCGTFVLGTNFDYRLTFLLLCFPQLLDWSRQASDESSKLSSCLLVLILAVLWLNGLADGHTTFLILPQLFDWILFSSLAAILFLIGLDNFVAPTAGTDKCNHASSAEGEWIFQPT